ncbi:MAG TPA: Rieske 2Fe-2S domain-containing protein [bacterium]
MPEDRDGYVDAGPADSLQEGDIEERQASGIDIILGRAAGRLFACLDRCPHAAAPLSQGRLENSVIRCARHGWTFDVHTGETVPQASAFTLRRIPIREEGGRILAKLPIGT